MTRTTTRRDFLTTVGPAAAVAALPLAWIELAFADASQNFTFGCIADAHIQHVSGTRFVRNWDRGLMRAVAEMNQVTPKPDFVVFGGDLAQLGTREELDHGAGIMSALRYETRYVMGEHDYYLDLGEYWSRLFGPQHYSFDHKGVHFVVLNSVLTRDDWTFGRWPAAKQRMREMAGLDNPQAPPFMVGETQREWLKKDLAKLRNDTPVVVFSHSPLQKIFRRWNFWTEDAEDVQALLERFDTVNVVYGHVHQIQHGRAGNIRFSSVMATAWPWPRPQGYAQAGLHLPKLTVPVNRAGPFPERDATGWQMINTRTGRVDLAYRLYGNDDRTVAFDPGRGPQADACGGTCTQFRARAGPVVPT